MEEKEINEQLAEVNPEGFFNELSSQVSNIFLIMKNACSVRVAVRVRPLIGRELNESGSSGGRTCVVVSDIDNKLQIGEKQFQFDRTFSSDCNQQEIFDVCAKNLVVGCFVGYNATILAYGQTGSGKTHTMGTGSTNGLDNEQIGIVPRVFEFVFEELERRKKQQSLSEFTIKISFLELYNEELHDLLDPLTIGAIDKLTGKPIKELFIKEKSGSIYIQGLKEEIVSSKEECLELLNKGISHRTTSATLMNEGSSRSHAILTISIEQNLVKELELGNENQQQEEHIKAKFHFVDLAGSERIKKTLATGILMKEGISINKGLSCLGNVISALTDDMRKDKHIPYRDSKLTRILQDSLGGNSRTTMIACVSPAESNYEESLNSIKYASRARNIKNKAVVNRDPNSLLIESLKRQISQLQGEITVYKQLLIDSGIQIPNDFQESVFQKIEEQKSFSAKSLNSNQNVESIQGTGQTPLDLREIKIKLSKKEIELKQFRDNLQNITDKLIQKSTDYELLQKERDLLLLQNEMINKELEKQGIQIDFTQINRGTEKLIDEYKTNLEILQKDFEKKSQELTEAKKKIGELSYKKQIDDQLLNKKIEHIKKLEGILKKQEINSGPITSSNSSNQSPIKGGEQQPKFKLNLQGIKNENIQTRKQDITNFILNSEGVQKKFIDNLSLQLDSFFSEESIPQLSNRSPRKRSRTPGEDNLISSEEDDQQQNSESNEETSGKNLEDKERILTLAKSSVSQLQSELVEMMKNQYEQQALQIETTMKTMDSEKQATLRKATDVKQVQAIELQYKQKMDDLAKQLQVAKEKEKQQQQMSRQITLSEAKIKNLEDDMARIRKNKEYIEKQMKSDMDKHAQFKKKYEKELISTKKAVTNKEKEVKELKQAIKKTDQERNSKIIELRALQNKIFEDKLRRDLEKYDDHSKKGIDIDRIKVWITQNTDKMLRHRLIEEEMQKHSEEKLRIEDEIIIEGDKLNEATLDKERKEIELQQLEIIAEDQEESDVGPIIILEDQIYLAIQEIEQITNRLDTLENSYNFHNNCLDKLNGEAIALDAQNIEPLKLTGLQSIDAARVTLQTMLSVLLDANIFKRDLENKCIESDETILELNDNLLALKQQINDLTNRLKNNQVPSVFVGEKPNLQTKVTGTKENAIKNALNVCQIFLILQYAIDGIVEFENVKNLGLTAEQHNQITKLGLAKIVANVKQELKEEKTRTHNLTLKLEQALSDKEQLRLKYDNLRKKMKDDAIIKDPLAQPSFKFDQMPKQQFQSLEAARANKRQNQTITNKPDDQNKPGITIQTKFRSRMTVQSKINDEQASKLGQQSGRYNYKKQPFGRSRSNSKDKLQDSINPLIQKQKTNYIKGQKQKPETFQPDVSQANKKPQVYGLKQTLHLQPEIIQEDIQVLNQEESFQDSSQSRPFITYNSLQDRRNQRKMIHAQTNDNFNQEIEKIKETAQQITSNQSHYDRRESRARDFSLKMQNERGQSSSRSTNNQMVGSKLMVQNLNGLVEDDNEESPRGNKSSLTQALIPEFDGNNYGYDEEGLTQGQNDMEVQPISSKNQIMGKWNYEDLAEIESFGQKLIATECMNESIILVFDTFMVRQIDLSSLEENFKPFNILENNNISHSQKQIAVDFAIDKELEAFIISTSSTIYTFDFQFTFLSKIDQLENIERVLFCSFHIVALVNDSQSYFLRCFQLDDGEELGFYQIYSSQDKILVRTDNTYIYVGCGIFLAKLNVPDLSQIYLIETEHQAPITDMTIITSAIITTSADKTVKVSSISNGEQCMNSLDELDCDHLESSEDFILARINQGETIYIFRFYQGAKDLDLIDEINIEQLKNSLQGMEQEFRMQGNIRTKFSNSYYDVVLLVTVIPEAILVHALKHKPLSEI